MRFLYLELLIVLCLDWPFMYENDLLADFFKEIPSKVDIIVSHDAPYGTSDVCSEGMAKYEGHIGNKGL